MDSDSETDTNEGNDKPVYRGPVLFYTDEVIDHFTHPRNVGEMPESETDGYARVGDPGCGDEMEMWISVRDGRIERASFKSYGCPGAISTSSMATVLAQGKTIPEARALSDDDIVNALKGLPENKKHCSLLGIRALHAALEDYEKRGKKAD